MKDQPKIGGAALHLLSEEKLLMLLRLINGACNVGSGLKMLIEPI